jgi:hypothetical protein
MKWRPIIRIMEKIEQAAHVSIGRACGFCGLAILCFMVGLSYDPALAAKLAGASALAVSGVLILRSRLVAHTPYKQTETWLILAEEHRPPPAQAQQVISRVLGRVYLEYARYAAVAAAVLVLTSMILGALAG